MRQINALPFNEKLLVAGKKPMQKLANLPGRGPMACLIRWN
jgi:hypothetical protein